MPQWQKETHSSWMFFACQRRIDIYGVHDLQLAASWNYCAKALMNVSVLELPQADGSSQVLHRRRRCDMVRSCIFWRAFGCPYVARFVPTFHKIQTLRKRTDKDGTCLKPGFCFPWASASASRSFGPNLCPTAAAKPPSCTSDCSGSLRTTGWTGAHFQRTFESFGRGNIAVDVVYGMESPSWSQLEINKT